MDRKAIILFVVAVLIWVPVQIFAQPTATFPTEIDLNLLNPDGSNTDTSLLLIIDYTDGNSNPASMDSVNNAGLGNDGKTLNWDIYEGKSSVYSMVEAMDGTDITITVEGYDPIVVTAISGGQIIGDHTLTPIQSGATTTTTTTVTTTTATTSTTTIQASESSYVPTKVFIKEEEIVMTVSVIGSGSSATFAIPPSKKTPLRKLVLKVDEEVKDVEMTVSTLSEKPAYVETGVEGVLYEYINISHTVNDEKISSATIKFIVEKSWINENGIDPVSITLDRYFGSEWTSLPTTSLSDDLDSYSYEAVSPGLSIFGISGSIRADALTTTTTVTQAESPPPTATAESIGPLITTAPPESNERNEKVLLFVLALAIVAFSAYYLRKR